MNRIGRNVESRAFSPFRRSIAYLGIFLFMFSLATVPSPAAAADYYYYAWDSGSHGTYVTGWASAAADHSIDGRLNVEAIGTWFSYASAWARLELAVAGTGSWTTPELHYTANGWVIFSYGATLTFWVTNAGTGETIVSGQRTLPYGETIESLELPKFWSAGATFVYHVKVEASAAGADVTVDFYGPDYRKVQINYLHLKVTSGGGGCVAEGTPILTASGEYIPVEQVEVGDKLMGYDFDEQGLVPLKVKSVDVTVVEELLNINEGLLRVTPVDQPIYVRKGSFEGWLANPRDLEVGDELFDAVNEQWIAVESLTYEGGSFVVYDLRLRGTDTYIANDILVDAK